MGTSDRDSDGDMAWVRQTLMALVLVIGLVFLIALPLIAAAITSVTRQGVMGSNK